MRAGEGGRRWRERGRQEVKKQATGKEIEFEGRGGRSTGEGKGKGLRVREEEGRKFEGKVKCRI